MRFCWRISKKKKNYQQPNSSWRTTLPMKPEENDPPIRESQQIKEKELSSDHALLWNIVNDIIESPYLVHSLIILYCVDIFYLITAFVVIYRTVIHSLIKDKHTTFKFTFFYCCSSQNWLVCFMILFNSFVKPLKCFNVLNTWNPLNTSTSKTAWKTDSVCVNMLELL